MPSLVDRDSQDCVGRIRLKLKMTGEATKWAERVVENRNHPLTINYPCMSEAVIFPLDYFILLIFSLLRCYFAYLKSFLWFFKNGNLTIPPTSLLLYHFLFSSCLPVISVVVKGHLRGSIHLFIMFIEINAENEEKLVRDIYKKSQSKNKKKLLSLFFCRQIDQIYQSHHHLIFTLNQTHNFLPEK